MDSPQALISVGETEVEPEFRWGKKKGKGGKNKDVQFYESFTYDGEDYALYDCVYLHAGESIPYIAKILKIWENGDKTKRVKVQWFFYPFEVDYYLDGVEFMQNELFFASGAGKFLTNLNPLEAIAGKCNILCISKDSRNPQPSAEEIQMADYVFYRTFDVGSCTISDHFGETVGGLDVEFIFNRKEDIDRLHSIRKDEKMNVIEFREPETSHGLENVNLDEGFHNMLEKDSSSVGHVQAKQASEEKETKSRKKDSSPVRECSNVDMIPDGCKEVIEKASSLGAECAGGKVSAAKDEFQGIELQINQVQDDVKFSNKSSTLDKTPPNQAHIDGKASSRVKPTDITVLSEKDSSQLILGEEVGGKYDLRGPERAAKMDKPSSGLLRDEAKKCADLSKEKRKYGDDVAQEIKDTLSTKDLCHEGPTKMAKLDGVTRKPKADDNGENNKTKSCEDSYRKAQCDGDDDNSTNKKLKKITGRSDGDSTRKKVDDNKAKKIFSESDSKSSPMHLFSNNANHEIGDTILHEDSHKMKCPIKNEKVEDSTRKVVYNDENDTVNKLKRKICARETKNSPTLLSSENANYENEDIKASSIGEGVTKKKRMEGSTGKSKVGYVDHNKIGGSDSPIPMASNADKGKSRIDNGSSKSHLNEQGKLSNDGLHKASINTSKGNGKKVEGQRFEVVQRPNEKGNWIKLPWMERMKAADDQGKLVLLLNLPASYTSGEVEDIIWDALEESCIAKVLPHTATSNPNSGQAFAIFKTREAAERVVERLDDGCLMLATSWALVACIPVLPKSVKQISFFGHLSIEKARMQIQRELKDVVSTSHYSQNNTVEYEMAMLWCLQQSRFEECLKKLYEEQMKNMKKLMVGLKSQVNICRAIR